MSNAEKARLLANLRGSATEVLSSHSEDSKNINDAFRQRYEKQPEKIPELNYPFLFAVYIACADGQIHKHEVDMLLEKANDLQLNKETLEEMAKIFAKDNLAVALDVVLEKIGREHCQDAVNLAVLIAAIDGGIDQEEQLLIDRLCAFWNIEQQMRGIIQKEALTAATEYRKNKKIEEQGAKISGKMKFLKGLDTVLSKKIVDKLVDVLGKESTKEFVEEARTQILLQGPEYDEAIERCKKIGLEDLVVVDNCLQITQQTLLVLENDINDVIVSFENKYSQSLSVKEVIGYLKGDKEVINTKLNASIKTLMDTQIKKRRAIDYFTISFMGKSKAGKSTLHAIVTGEGWDAIGVGKQNTTKFNRVYEWHNIRIIDTPGIAAPIGEDYQRIAESIIDESDLMCFVVTNNNQQKAEFEFLKMLKDKGKPLLVLLNVQENLTQSTRLKRFLENPNHIFSDDKAKLGGHLDRIKRDASEYYGTQDFPIIPVQLLAARLSREELDIEKAKVLMKASRLQHYLDEVRVSLIKEGTIRRSQNLLGSTVIDIEKPLRWLKGQVTHYQKIQQTMQERSITAQSDIQKAIQQGQNALRSAIKKVFENAKKQINSFANEHWDDDQDDINSAWHDKLRQINFEKSITNAIEKINIDFSQSVQSILEEIGKELQLISQLENTFTLNAQDSNDFGHQATKWGGQILGVAGGVMVLLSNPLGWVVGIGGAILGFLSSFFESRESKKRKAVAKITSALEEQMLKQEKQILDKMISQFSKQAESIIKNVHDYFEQIITSTAEVEKKLRKADVVLEEQIQTLNIGFAMRVIDYAEGKTNTLDLEKAKKVIANVKRQVGHSMEIEFVAKVPRKLQFSEVEKTIQEKILTTSKVI